MEVNIVDITEFLYINSPKTNKKEFSAHWVKPFIRFKNAIKYVNETLKEEGYPDNKIFDMISEDEHWEGDKLLKDYVLFGSFIIEDPKKVSYKRYTGYKIIVQDEKSQTYKKIIITIQTEKTWR